MKKLRFACVVAMALLGGCGGGGQRAVAPAAPTQATGPAGSTTAPYVMRAHPPGFGLPPKSVKLRPPMAQGVPTMEMFDSVTVSTVPRGARAVAGYTSGYWPTYWPLVQAFPHARHVSIAINVAHRARCLDIEPGDATPSQAASWFYSVHASVRKPCFYANLSTMPAVRSNLTAHGIARVRYLLWDADWTYHAHLDAGYDCTQTSDRALNRNLDESTCALSFFGSSPRPAPRPKPHPSRKTRLRRYYKERRAVRAYLLSHSCRARVRKHEHVGPKCDAEFRRGNAVNRAIHRLGGH